MNKIIITKKSTIPIEISPEGVKEAIEDYIRKADPEIVFPTEYNIKFEDTESARAYLRYEYPSISINLEITEARKPGKRGRDKAPRKRKQAAVKPPLTEAEANHIVVKLGATWSDLPMGDYENWEESLGAISEVKGLKWQDYDDRR